MNSLNFSMSSSFSWIMKSLYSMIGPKLNCPLQMTTVTVEAPLYQVPTHVCHYTFPKKTKALPGGLERRFWNHISTVETNGKINFPVPTND